MAATDFDKLLESMEPAATKGVSDFPDIAAFSAAISAKRTADALESVAASLSDMAKWGWQGTLAVTPFTGGN